MRGKKYERQQLQPIKQFIVLFLVFKLNISVKILGKKKQNFVIEVGNLTKGENLCFRAMEYL